MNLFWGMDFWFLNPDIDMKEYCSEESGWIDRGKYYELNGVFDDEFVWIYKATRRIVQVGYNGWCFDAIASNIVIRSREEMERLVKLENEYNSEMDV